MSVIETVELRKNYGPVEALRGVSIRVEPGEIYGLLGQNGAGKTTLIKIMLGIVHKSEGDASLLGLPVGTVEARKRVGYLPEDHAFPGYHTARTLMDFYGQIYGLSRGERQKKIPEMLEVVGIRKRMDHRIRTYSKGMKQRLGIAQAMFHDPAVIFLDEPTDGVDPVGRREIRDLMQRLKSEGKTVFLNSHLLGEVELICDRVAILHQGELVRQGTVADLTRQQNRFVIGLAGGQAFPTEDVTRLGYTVEPAGDLVEVVLPDDKTVDPVLGLLQTRGLNLRHLVEKKQSLEDVFVSMVDAADADGDVRADSGGRPVKAVRQVGAPRRRK
ncbi:abc transporter : ABC transporter related protein OS=Sphaerobacter thermophilus (strain DSM 20745 / S 6022) GN=Sthe_2191 PE=3 SV=1: ABC_tran [Gemmata massiliana]|uniref:ABC transporter domain-containing protein n=1 Tax=Gemmata massiliana TaxID=1210884 RepID=A0A6P2DHW3_9BACT|nr:ABC transporter ATP-binding protein [Gemmata massiliana]VTS02088.1 abc transporter : ABC transporter related protein OS=Sphaerobacter thermophilus (strain DSM 20745 / S 6022) GN=Sthe_2191 PE=3 SV=1: ABC_tran [Gemmata massiliana]